MAIFGGFGNPFKFAPWGAHPFSVLDAPDLYLVPKHNKVEIYWANPIQTNFEKTIIMYSIVDYPEIDGDYLEDVLVIDYNVPLSLSSYTHNGLLNNVTYYYTAVSYDTAGHTNTARGTAVPTPSATVSNVRITGKNEAVIILWDNPTYSEFPLFQNVIIRRKEGDYPTDVNDGVLVYEGTGTSLIDIGLINGTEYFYSIWTVDTYDEVIYPSVDVSEYAVDAIIPVGSVVINDGDNVTYTPFITLKFQVEDNETVTGMKISNSSDFENAVYEPYDSKKEWILNYEEGNQTVYVKFRDSVYNESEVAYATIYLSFDWIDLVTSTKSSIMGMSENSNYGVGILSKSDNYIGLMADGARYDLYLKNMKIKTDSGNGILLVDGKRIGKYKYYR